MKIGLFNISLIMTICLVFSTELFSQTTDKKNSLRHYLGQSKAYIVNNFQYCHFEENEKTWTFKCNNDDFIIHKKNGLSTSVTYWPNKQSKVSLLFSTEIKLLTDEGWKIISQTTDEYGSIDYTFKKSSKCIRCFYVPMMGRLTFEICDINN